MSSTPLRTRMLTGRSLEQAPAVRSVNWALRGERALLVLGLALTALLSAHMGDPRHWDSVEYIKYAIGF
ncbi:MAG TPA: hypothetical protein VG015_00560, partial [Candidatus Dormibacteraeota bacterium]|nr:hypothetical protein [Candidatus Dormibacteraeota bacterium]